MNENKNDTAQILEKLQEMADAYAPRYTYPATHPCPSCGHCPTCGRGGAPYYPYYPMSPAPYPYITWTTCC